MITLDVNKLMLQTPQQVFHDLSGDFNIKYSDGRIVPHSAKMTSFSRYCWELNRKYDYPVYPEFHADVFLEDRVFSGDLHLKILNTVLWRLKDERNEDVFEMCKVVMEITSNIYNDFNTLVDEHVSTISYLDFFELFQCPEFLKIKAEGGTSDVEIIETYQKMRHWLYTAPNLEHNNVICNARANTIKMDQLLQCLGPVGYRTDLDSSIFPKPIMRGFVEGITELSDSLIESRAASISMANESTLTENTSYLKRKMEMVAMNLQHLFRGDCGSTRYTEHFVRPKVVDEKSGRTLKPSDVDSLVGTYYLNGDKVDWIRGTETHLENTTIKLRTLNGCIHPQSNTVCEVCLGKISDSIPEHTSVGECLVMVILNKMIQAALSTKHLILSSLTDSIYIKEADKRYIGIHEDQDGYVLNEELSKLNPVLTLLPKAIPGIDLLLNSSKVTVPLHGISEISNLFITHDVVSTKGNSVRKTARISLKESVSEPSFTMEFLEHIRKYRWTQTAKNHYEFSLDNWDFSKKILVHPSKQYTLRQFIKELSGFLESKGEDTYHLKNYQPDEAVIHFMDMVNNRLATSYSHAQVMCYIFQAYNPEEGDYRLPNGLIEGTLVNYSSIIKNRSMGAALAYQGIFKLFNSLDVFPGNPKPDHPMDYIIMPELLNPK